MTVLASTPGQIAGQGKGTGNGEGDPSFPPLHTQAECDTASANATAARVAAVAKWQAAVDEKWEVGQATTAVSAARESKAATMRMTAQGTADLATVDAKKVDAGYAVWLGDQRVATGDAPYFWLSTFRFLAGNGYYATGAWDSAYAEFTESGGCAVSAYVEYGSGLVKYQDASSLLSEAMTILNRY